MDTFTDSGCLNSYLSSLAQFSVLTREEERDLAIRYKRFGDREAGATLVTANLRFVVKVALKYKSSGAGLMDLIQEGNVGLIRAVEKFDPDRGSRLVSYAVWWIKAHIRKYLMEYKSLVKIGTTEAQRKLFYQVSSLPDISDRKGRQKFIASLAQRLSVSEDLVIDMETRVRTPDLSLDDTDGIFWNGLQSPLLRDNSMNQEDLLVENQEQAHIKSWLSEALRSLSSRERYVLKKRILTEDRMTLQEVGKHFGVSRERARQIEKAALLKLKRDYVRRPDAA